MKKILSFFASALVMGAMVFTSCQGPEGPEGPVGPQGPAGDNGIASCGQCHDLSTDMYARIVQYENSTHYLGGNFERNTSSCAICHTHEGFIDNLATGAGESDAALENPSPINCRTCHKIHDTYTSDDWELTATDAVTFFDGTESIDMGSANLCANCHQARSYDVPVAGGADITVTSSRYGPHHGPQSNLINAHGFYLFNGSSSYPSTYPHQNVPNSCVGCHMATPFGKQAGGHTWKMAYDYHGATELNTAGCTTCHGSEDFVAEAEEFMVEIETLTDSLHTILEGLGYLTSSGGTVTGTYSPDVAGAMLNFKTVEEDRSKGVHNPYLVKAVLENTIEAASNF